MLARRPVVRGLLRLSVLPTALAAGAAGSSFSVAGEPSDASTDATMADASMADASSDAATDGGFGCTDTFCADFDEPDSLAAWGPPLETNGASVLVDTTASRSAPSSLHLATSAKADAGVSAATALRKDFGIYQGLRCTFDVRMDTVGPATTAAQIVAVQISDGAQFFQVIVDLFAEGYLQISTQASGVASTGFFKTTSRPLGPGAWKRLSLDVGFEGSERPPAAILGLDGNVLATVPISPTVSTGPVSVKLGLNYVSPGNATWDMHVDNVGCTPR